MKNTRLYIYGLEHGYWIDWSHFQRISNHDIELIADMFLNENTGEFTEEKIQNLIDFKEERNAKFE